MALRIGWIAVFAAFLSGCVEISHILGSKSGPQPGTSFNWPDEDDLDDNDNLPDNANDNAADEDSPIFGGIGGIPPLTGLETVTTDSGLTYLDIEEGQGAEPEPSARVTVNYVGWLTDGTEFDSGDGVQFSLAGVIAGWTEGVSSMRIGGRRRLLIPPELAYGEAGSPPKIPANATLVFDVDLLEIEN